MPRNDWILDVLADLKAFAGSNGLTALSEQLDDTMLIAAAELEAQSQTLCGDTQDGATSRTGKAGPNAGGSGQHRHA